MSVQVISCAPYQFFKDCEFRAPGWWVAWRFVSFVRAHTGVRLPFADSSHEFCEDLLSEASLDLTSLVAAECDEKTDECFQVDLVLPSSASLHLSLTFPHDWYGSDGPLRVCSTADYSAALDAIEPILKRKPDKQEVFQQHLDCFREAVAFSEKHRFPIFWSV